MKRTVIYLICIVPLLGGCLDIKLDNQFSDPDAITTVATARELLATAYNTLPRYQYELAVLSDDFYRTNYTKQDAEIQNLYLWQDNALTNFSEQIWREYYLTVAYINALLQRVDNVVTDGPEDESELQKIISEAKILKAWCYFDLLRFYAPAYSETNLERDGIILKDRLELDFLPRSSVKTCVETINRLFEEAAKVENDSPVYYLGSVARNALRAEFELYLGRYDKVVEYGSPLMAGVESRWTEASYEDLWSDDASDDRIFAPYIFDSFYTGLCYDKEIGDYFRLSDDVAYEDGDIRKEWSEYSGPMGAVRCLGKYNRMYYENTEVRYVNILRYSGVCFTVAEAYARSGNETEAIALMNGYLSARGVAALPSSIEGNALIEAILREKQKELVGEGTRYFDLKRLGRNVPRYDDKGGMVSEIRSDDYRMLLPIPKSEYKYNKNITEANQNPHWAYEKTE